MANETIIDKPGKGSFYATDLELVLHTRGIKNLIITGITTDVCVHTTMREANDRGFECMVLSDCCAATEQKHHEAALSMIKMQGGIFGAVTDSATLLDALATA
ncbi:Isochorismatase family protein yecD [Ewingella americana]|uniref:Isochorismatase family protein yecD n=1 Tax=Ewingella americana TaxID=41202 RepID=A0A377NGZ2_9GAMM|nr:Isochorismatase family protein yecD [Ewingella americana]